MRVRKMGTHKARVEYASGQVLVTFNGRYAVRKAYEWMESQQDNSTSHIPARRETKPKQSAGFVSLPTMRPWRREAGIHGLIG